MFFQRIDAETQRQAQRRQLDPVFSALASASLRLCVEIAFLVNLVFSLTGCGYHISGRGDLLPKTIKTIAIPAFSNVTTRYKLARTLPTDIGRELLSRTSYKIVADPNQADAVLTGTLTNFAAYATCLLYTSPSPRD